MRIALIVVPLVLLFAVAGFFAFKIIGLKQRLVGQLEAALPGHVGILLAVQDAHRAGQRDGPVEQAMQVAIVEHALGGIGVGIDNDGCFMYSKGISLFGHGRSLRSGLRKHGGEKDCG